MRIEGEIWVMEVIRRVWRVFIEVNLVTRAGRERHGVRLFGREYSRCPGVRLLFCLCDFLWLLPFRSIPSMSE